MESIQSEVNKKKNEDFFLNHLDSYRDMVSDLDTYKNIFLTVNEEVNGVDSLIDIGNGGVFAYTPSLVNKITAVDLFLDSLDASKYPSNVLLKQGNALELSEPDAHYDAVLVVMLIHHLVGRNVLETEQNLGKCLGECYRVLKPGGKLIIVESCIPSWFYFFEKRLFPIANFLISKYITHPMAFQYPQIMITKEIQKLFGACETKEIPKGRYVIQLGWKVRSFLTPVQPYLFTTRKIH
jgi:ubiquinone/menaquinone biosynthesis C-methylase UbiE